MWQRRNPHRFKFFVLALLAILLLAACGGQPVNQTFSTINSGLSEGAARENAPSAPTTAPAAAATAAPAATFALAAPASDALASAPSVAPIAEGGEAAPTSPGSSGAPEPRRPEGQVAALKAGEIDDNALFADYLSYLSGYSDLPARPLDVRERYLISVIDENQRPLLGADVKVYDGQELVFESRTSAGGRTLFLPKASKLSENASELRVVAELGAGRGEASFQRGASEQIEVAVRGATAEQGLRLDLLFLLDTTGSMDDELSRIQETIDTIAQRIDGFSPRPSINWGLVAYRDVGDEYVTQRYDFSPELAGFRTALRELSAGGGGDTPEALDEALYEATQRMAWSSGAVRLIFLVADAAPHIDQQAQFTYLNGAEAAIKQGIKIYPIAASNTDPQAEYVFRQLAQQSLGSFIFLTYQPGASGGAPGESTPLEAGEQQYTVERLDDLIINVIERELAAAVGAR